MSTPKDLDLGKVGEHRLVGILSRNEEERVAKLRDYFEGYLGDWIARVVEGVRPSPGVMNALQSSLLKMAAAVALADPAVPDDTITESADTFTRQALELLEVLAKAQRAAVGVDKGAPA